MNITFVVIIVITVFLETVAVIWPNVTRIIGKFNKCGLDKSSIKVVYEGDARIQTYPRIGLLFYKIILPNVTRPSGQFNKCGLDKSPIKVVYEGDAKIETYPWIGLLFYKSDKTYSTPVVLVTRQIVIGSALDIDRLPKTDFRSRARVVLGNVCSRPGIKIKDYAYHPDFTKITYSSIVLIQLQTNYRIRDFYPVCPPPKTLEKPQFYVLALSDGNSFFALDMEKMWPTYTICARALSGKECIWKNGVILLLRQENRWSLIGLGIQGPGCRAPARFLDYVQHRAWLRSSVAGIGKPTITRISKNHIILRRSLSKVQRFGPCDREEIREELYTDRTTVNRYPTNKQQRASYNFTIFANLEYSCVVFRVFHYNYPRVIKDIPYIRLDRWCLSREPICYSFQFLQIEFSVTIWFKESVTYHVAAYGKEVKLIDRKKLMARLNSKYPLVKPTRSEKLRSVSDQ